MRYLNSAETRQALPMSDAIRAMEHAFSAEAETPLRTIVGSSLVMPGRLEDIIAVKVVSTVPGSPAGLVVVFAPDGQAILTASDDDTARLWRTASSTASAPASSTPVGPAPTSTNVSRSRCRSGSSSASACSNA